MNSPKIICLTPVKNEDWIIERFLQSASLWADHIIILDQSSTDRTLEIVSQFPKVILIKNESTVFNEPERQKMLIQEARKISGPKILIALDADEALTANSIHSTEWEIIKKLQPGTVLKFDWVNVLPSKNVYWQGLYKMPFGFVDDGSEHKGSKIHSDRIPNAPDYEVFFPKEIKVLHFQYADWKRMQSKHRWYQCFERVNGPQRSVISIYRQYHHMYSVPKKSFRDIPESWFSAYDALGINFRVFSPQESYYWDVKVLAFIKQNGANFFSRIDIWDIDWEKVAVQDGESDSSIFRDPRTRFDKMLFQYLEKTQPYMHHLIMKIFDRIPRIFF